MFTWKNIRLILGREIRDQLRDRRTLFMIAVLPLLLYPLMGASFFQLAQFLQEHPTQVLVIGATELARRHDSARLFAPQQQGFAEGLFERPHDGELLRLTFASADETLRAPFADKDAPSLEARAQEAMRRGGYDAVLCFEPDFLQRLRASQAALRDAKSRHADGPSVPSPVVYYNTAREASQIAQMRLEPLLRRWRDKVAEQNLRQINVPAEAVQPFVTVSVDVAEQSLRDAAMWSKILPFVLMIWTLTGAFYPAIDLCAGEKERGTLETLLSSPAQRSEIVVGKLLTVMLFSIGTAVLNLASMGITGALVIGNLQHLSKVAQFGMPPLSAVLWLGVASIPIAALFSALSVALAAFARSTKEGQYYLMPLILITLPLMMLPMAPGVELSLGNALIPVTGLMLLLRELIQGNYSQAAVCVLPVVAVTLTACWVAVRWAIDQFNRESVLFRESERLDLGLWLKHLVHDRPATPTVAMGVLCGVLILVLRFFSSVMTPAPTTTEGLLIVQVVSMIAFVALPALLMAAVLTRSPRRSLLLNRPRLATLAVAGLLAVTLHPVVIAFHRQLAELYHFDERALAGFAALLEGIQPWQALAVFALLPAVCEELVFRGFILTGLRQSGSLWRAIALSAVFFGLAHLTAQQSIGAVVLGLVLGVIAVRTGSLWPGVLFHLVHNSLTLGIGELAAQPATQWLFHPGEELPFYDPWVVAAGGLCSLGLLWALRRFTSPRVAAEWPSHSVQVRSVVGGMSTVPSADRRQPSLPAGASARL